MSAPVVDRPIVDFDAIEHAYKVEGVDVLGVSSVAKIGGADDAWGIASAWGFRVGYEGTWDLLDALLGDANPWPTKDDLRAALKERKLTPWDTKDKAAERGSWVHDLLEDLGQSGDVPDMKAFAEKHGAEAAGHAKSVLRFFLHFRPSFVGMEVQVASREHGFAGRYDVRCLIDARRLVPCLDPVRRDYQAERIREIARVADELELPMSGFGDRFVRGACALCLLDLKTSKSIYPTSHFPQLEGYEGAGVEMGFPATDARVVLNTWPTGEHHPAWTLENGEGDLRISWSTYEHFVTFLGALRSIKAIKADDPEELREAAIDEALLANLPGLSRDLAKLDDPALIGMDSRKIGMRLGQLRKKGKVVQDAKTKVWDLAPVEDAEAPQEAQDAPQEAAEAEPPFESDAALYERLEGEVEALAVEHESDGLIPAETTTAPGGEPEAVEGAGEGGV